MGMKHLPQAARWDSPLMDTGVEMVMADQGVNRVQGAKWCSRCSIDSIHDVMLFKTSHHRIQVHSM